MQGFKRGVGYSKALKILCTDDVADRIASYSLLSPWVGPGHIRVLSGSHVGNVKAHRHVIGCLFLFEDDLGHGGFWNEGLAWAVW